MAYLENDTKFVCIINRKAPLGIALNAAAHTLIGLSGSRPERLDLQEYPFAQQSYTSLISLYPVIVLRADNGNKLRTTVLAAEAEGIATNLFATSMVGESAAEQIAATKAVQLSDAEIVAAGLFGEARRLEPLTKRFSLFR